MKWIWISVLVVGLLMTNRFVPIKDGDWQALNIALEDLFYSNGGTVEARSVKKSSKETGIIQQKTIDGSDGTSTKESVPVIAVPNDQGQLDQYGEGNQQPDVGLPYSGRVHQTFAGQTIPSSFYLDLRAHTQGVSSKDRHVTADWIIVHDNSTPWKTIGLPNVDEVCATGETQTGSVAGQRDQTTAFSDQWVNIFIIYNSTTSNVSSLASLSATAPTLPTGYDYFVRTGTVYIATLGTIMVGKQIDKTVWNYHGALSDAEPALVDTAEAVDLSDCVPPTAISVFGCFGITSDVGADTYMIVGSTSSLLADADTSFIAGIPTLGTVPAGIMFPTYFNLPILTSQTLYWQAGVKHPHYGLDIHGWVDDL